MVRMVITFERLGTIHADVFADQLRRMGARRIQRGIKVEIVTNTVEAYFERIVELANEILLVAVRHW